jgi:hypothetical protein
LQKTQVRNSANRNSETRYLGVRTLAAAFGAHCEQGIVQRVQR